MTTFASVRRAVFPRISGSPSRSNPRGRLMARTRTIGKRRGQIPAGCRAKPGDKSPRHPCLQEIFRPQNCGAVAQTLLALGGGSKLPDYCDLTMSSALRPTGQLRTLAALVTQNCRGPVAGDARLRQHAFTGRRCGWIPEAVTTDHYLRAALRRMSARAETSWRN